MAVEKSFYFLAFVAALPFLYSKHVYVKTAPIDYYDDFPIPTEVEILYYWEPKTSNVCETEDCYRVANEIIGAMNWSVDPCVDFYEFTCGSWNLAHPLIPNAMVSNGFQINDNLVFRRISEIFEKDPDSSDILPVRKGKKWYRSCMDTESLNAKGIEPIQSILMQVGGWPISMEENEWSADDYPWQTIESFYAWLMGRNVFYDVKIGYSDRDSKYGRITLYPPVLLEKNRGQILHYKQTYTDLVMKVVKMFVKNNKAEVPNEVLNKQIQDLLQFERDVLKIITEGSPAAVYWPANPMIFGEFVDWYGSYIKEKYPTSQNSIHFEKGIRQILRSLNVDINRTEPIFVSSFKYFERIGGLLEQTPSRTIVNYVHWNFIFTMLKHTTEEMRDDIFAFTSYFRHLGAKKRSPRWMECAKETEMRYAAAYGFTKKYFTPSTENTVQEMIKNIQRGLEANVDNSDWLDENSKLLVKEKIKATSVSTGIPKWFRNDTAVTNYYKELTIGNQYFDNALSYMRFEIKRKLMAPVISGDDEYDFLDRLTVNALYNGDRHGVDLPPALFQPPLFTPGLPDIMYYFSNVNYGQAGFMVGHEFSHGFDNERFNQMRLGKLGLSEKIEKKYYQRARCFVNQYDNYFGVTKAPEDKEVSLKYDDLGDSFASNSNPENIADTTGLQAVYEAYRRLMIAKGTDEPKLPGLEEFTDDQLFFISFASYLCERRTPDSEKMNKGSSYSPAKLRVNGPLSNTDDFSKVFKCPIGSPMDPIDKCSVWRKTRSESEGIREK